jgi:hypothetical protein
VNSRAAGLSSRGLLAAVLLVSGAGCASDTDADSSTAPTPFPLPTFHLGPLPTADLLIDSGEVDGHAWQLYVDAAELDERLCYLAVVFDGETPSNGERQLVEGTHLSCYDAPQSGLAHPEPIVWGTSSGDRFPRVLMADIDAATVSDVQLIADGQPLEAHSTSPRVITWIVSTEGPYVVSFTGTSAVRSARLTCTLADGEIRVILGTCDVEP